MGSARRVIVILGAGGTLGTALSRQLAAEPDTDLVLSDLSEDALAQARDGIAVRGGAASAGAVATVPADISDLAAVENVVTHAVDRFGRLDVLARPAVRVNHPHRLGGRAHRLVALFSLLCHQGGGDPPGQGGRGGVRPRRDPR